jgi:hypothetical protein
VGFLVTIWFHTRASSSFYSADTICEFLDLFVAPNLRELRVAQILLARGERDWLTPFAEAIVYTAAHSLERFHVGFRLQYDAQFLAATQTMSSAEDIDAIRWNDLDEIFSQLRNLHALHINVNVCTRQNELPSQDDTVKFRMQLGQYIGERLRRLNGRKKLKTHVYLTLSQ